MGLQDCFHSECPELGKLFVKLPEVERRLEARDEVVAFHE